MRHRARCDKAASKQIGSAAAMPSMSLRKRLLHWNRVPDEKRPIPLAVQREIKAHFQEEVDKLGALIGRDLGQWLQPRE
jgi:hypothetical protein